ncbi:MAG: extracellular solute-binding protein [Eggerthellaceae bacterium]
MGNASGRDDEIVLTVSMPDQGAAAGAVGRDDQSSPHLRFEFDTYSNSNYSAQIVTELEQRDIPDILINTRNQDLTEDLEHNLVDLAAYDFSSEYLPSVLDRMTIDGSLYYLPGYLTLAGFFYNKDLFAEHGWGASVARGTHCPQRAGEGGGHPAHGVLDGADGSTLPAADQYRFGAVSAHAAGSSGTGLSCGRSGMVGVRAFHGQYRLWLDSGLISADDLSLSNSAPRRCSRTVTWP